METTGFHGCNEGRNREKNVARAYDAFDLSIERDKAALVRGWHAFKRIRFVSCELGK